MRFTDFSDFSSAHVQINPPNTFEPSNSFEISILGDTFFEVEEVVVISLNSPRFLNLPTPFQSRTSQSAPGSTIRIPGEDRIKLELGSTTIVIQEGKLV